jgi:P3 major capsid protein
MLKAFKSSVYSSAIVSKTPEYARMMAMADPTAIATAAGSGSQAQQAAANNQMASQLIRSRGVKMIQQIYSQTVNPANTPVLNVQPQPVGLVLGFLVEVNATLAQPTGVNAYALTEFGPANAFSQIQFNDLSNVTRVQTTGWHLHCINSAKGGIPYAGVRPLTNYPVAFGDNFGGNLAANQAQNIIQAPAQYDNTHYTSGLQMMYWVPLAYSMDDFRGSYFAGVVNANANLQLTINPSTQAFVANTADPINAVYQAIGGSTTGGWGTSFNVTVYQIYYDQIPVDPKSGQRILPFLSMSIIYDIKNTAQPGVTANQDFPIPYSNFRDFLSTVAIYDNPNSGVFGTPGADITQWSLRQANSMNIFQYEPKLSGLFSRSIIGDDFPGNVYYFDSRNKPISTVTYGNMQLVLRAASANGTPQVLVGFESFSYQNTIVAAASLNSGT